MSGSVRPSGANRPPTVSELIVDFLEYAQVYYRQRDGLTSNEYGHYATALGILRQHYGPFPTQEFGPRKLKAIRQSLVDKRLSRGHCNKQTQRIVRLFKWAVAEELVPPATYQALVALEGLKQGRCDARETKPIRPVAQATVDATLAELPADMIRVQLLTGMRPGEVCAMRPMDLDRSGDVWLA